MAFNVEIFSPGDFEPENHFYPKALNSQLHSMVSHFFNLNHERIVERYVHLNPQINGDDLYKILKTTCKHFYWGGADLFYVTTQSGERRMVILETNSCPSGQKSMPPRGDADEFRGYRRLLENAFLPRLKKRRLPSGGLAVIYDKNYMESAGYASTLADLTGEKVYLVPHFHDRQDYARFQDGVLQIYYNDQWHPIRAAFRYVTQKPWLHIPIHCRTFIFNGTLVCLAGGRNKLMASKAYELFNSEIIESGLRINSPETIRDVSLLEIPLWVKRFGGYAVIKNPYSNAGQGVFTITSEKELDQFMNIEHHYERFIVQSLVGHFNWSSTGSQGKYYHIGTIPNKKSQIFVADLRMMVYSSPDGIYPCALYARRAKSHLEEEIKNSSWEVLGTNLSINLGSHQWSSDVNRLMMMDRKDFNTLGIGTDDLIEAYIQTVLSVISIDKMSQNFINKKGQFRMKLFKSLNEDPTLINEVNIGKAPL